MIGSGGEALAGANCRPFFRAGRYNRGPEHRLTEEES